MSLNCDAGISEGLNESILSETNLNVSKLLKPTDKDVRTRSNDTKSKLQNTNQLLKSYRIIQ